MLEELFYLFDRSKKIIKFVVVTFVFLVTTALILVLYLNFSESEGKTNNKYVGTTTRRIVPSTTKRTTTTTPIFEEEITTSRVTTSPRTTTKATTTKKTTTKKGNTTKKTTKVTTTTKKTTKRTTTKIVTATTKKTTTPIREVTDSQTTYPGAVDFWAWGILDLINEERESMGYVPLKMAVDLRDLAEQAADYWYDHNANQVTNYIGDNNFYARQLVNANYYLSYNYLFDVTLSKTDIARNKYYRYAGIGVIYRERSKLNMPTHYYVIIYE